jgi:diadenosine tetraphosphatase ApaH/serine/threonine PP2A family protein phosphatase
MQALSEHDSGLGTDEGWLYSLQGQFEQDGVLYVHGSPLSDVESFAQEANGEDERLLAGVQDRTVVFGHSHLQFARPGPNGTTLVNPGSAGMPLDGDPRAAYALRNENREFEFHRVEYDVERAARAWEGVGGEFGTFAAKRVRRGSD